MVYTPVFKPFASRLLSQKTAGHSVLTHGVLRDQLTIPGWLLLGATLQGLLCLLPYRNIALVAPTFIFIAFRALRSLLMIFGITKNTYMEGVIPGRSVPIIASEKGERNGPAEQQLCVINLGTRSNHPLGIFAPGFAEVGRRFDEMVVELDKDPEKYGFLGCNAMLNTTDRSHGSELNNILYFKSLEHLHDFAHGPMHTDALVWWSQEAKKLGHISINHEIYVAPKNSWEGTFINNHPTGLGATSTLATMDDGSKAWVNSLVKGKGKLTYSKGRMGRDFH